MKKQTYQYGVESEAAAISFLENKGYKIISGRYKTKLGEMSLILTITLM